jgi:hypothetical protein
MPVQNTNDVLTPAFQLLASIVREFHAMGRPCLGATLKPKLCKKNFDEKALGFRKFGDFLRLAAANGYVKLADTVGGDIAISPGAGSWIPSAPPQLPLPLEEPVAVTHDSVGVVRVRPDLWNAFNSFSDNWVYDPVRDVAFKDLNGSVHRQAHGTPTPKDLIHIPPGRERVVEWMRSFANAQEAEARLSLLAVIDSDAGLYQFSNVTRIKGLQRGWSRFHIRNLLSAIEAWASVNSVRPKSVTTPLHLPSLARVEINAAPEPPSVKVIQDPRAPAVNGIDPLLASKLETAIDGLIDQLISLRGLLQVVGPKRIKD